MSSDRHSANQRRFALFTFFVFLFTFFFHPPGVRAQVSVVTIGTGYTQNFDTLPASGSATWTNNSNIPGWFHARTGTGTTIVANDGSSNAGNLYSYGTGTATDRALGSVGSGNAAIGNLFWGVRLQNNTGTTINTLDISYTGEQWRNSAAAAQTVAFSYLVGSPTVTGSLAEFQSSGVGVPQLDFISPITGGAAGALNGNLAANRVAITHSITGLSIPNGTEIMLRWSDPDHTGADHGLGIDDLTVTPQGIGIPTPNLTINDVSQAEGNGGPTTFTFAVTLTAPAGPGGVTFDIATADGTAQDDNPATEDNDYVPQSLTGQSIPMGSTGPYNFSVTVNGDTAVEPNETFFANVTSVTGANVADGQGQGTITNDDFTLTPIHDIQGNGAASPLAGQTLTTSGIVTLLRTSANTGAGAASGFFLQDPNADADPNTSEGIFVFMSSVPTVAVGEEVHVTGTIVEFNGLTEIGSVTNVTVIDSGNPLPTSVTLTTADLDPTAAPSQPQLEKYESMRVGGTFRTVAPNDDFFDVETVLSTVARPLRGAGIEVSNPVPPDPTSGTPDCCIQLWDENPERLKIDTNGRAGAPILPYTSNVTFTNVAGPLDYAFGDYRLVADAAPNASANISVVPVVTPTADEFTVAGYNIENFNNNAVQREKASLTIRTVLKYPDIIGTVEIFDFADLQALRDEVNNDAVGAGDPNPMYEAYLVEADGTSEDNDQDVGFLVKTARVAVTNVTLRNATETYINPNNGLPELLNDRPPLVLRAVVNPSQPNALPVIVIVNHLRSFIDIELVSGEGPRVRTKRKAQAESLAALLQEYQTSDSATPIISVGDYNAFQFNSGYDDSLSVITGDPTSDDQIVVDQSPDLVNPNFYNLIEDLPADQRYSFIFEGTPQALDHVVVNAVAKNRNTGMAIARVNADFPEAPAAEYLNNASRAERNSDHDPVISYYSLVEAPTITGATISRQQGSNSANSQIATVNDDDQVENTLVVTVDGGASATMTGITVSNIAVDASGNVTADVVASCTATNATFTLTVTDGTGASANGTLTVNVTPNTPPSVGTYSTTNVNNGAGTTVTPSAAPADNGSITSATVMASPGFTGTLSVDQTTGVVTVGNAGPFGSYTVTVTFTDNCGATTSPTFTLNVIDVTPPDTTIDSNPPALANSNAASFTFSGTDTESGVASFECKLDTGIFAACATPKNYVALSEGSHTFQVKAIDASGNVDPTPASYTWTVDTDPPDVTINQASGQSDPANGMGITIHFTAVFNEAVTGFTNGDVTLSGTAGATTVVVTQIGPMNGTTYDVAVSGMTMGGTVTASIGANKATDAAGNGNAASTSTDNTVTYVPNTPPTANPDSYSTVQDTPLNVAAPGVLSNDSDPDAGNTITAVLVSGPTNAASFSLNANGSFNYAPTAGFTGTDSFTYKARDNFNADSNTVTVTLNVQYKFAWFSYSGLLFNEQALNQVTAGSDVPVRFTLYGNKGNPYSSPPTSQQINCSTQATIGASTVINRYMPDPFYSSLYDFYQTTWRTQTTWKFTCRRLTLHLNDGTTRSLNFYFK